MKLRHAMVCASNQNRSMEAHALLQREGLDVSSYGTGNQVKLPGPTIRDPNIYQFGTPYTAIIEDLKNKDPDLYKRNGLLPMLKRNASVKDAPQRWQDNAGDGAFDVVLTFEERVFDLVNEDLQNREQTLFKTVLVVNLDVKDNHEEAAVGAKLALDLCKKVKFLSLDPNLDPSRCLLEIFRMVFVPLTLLRKKMTNERGFFFLSSPLQAR
ncbi:RNA polymerase II subunit A C-terminal domain phosphatase ssu72 isoform X1 [Selaginella moellendorffii]|uniref:RNA polymerase II subunit A C-terminal domain phosphatase ssu72 isoform X1 n=1 Tax=Selaginella moellendorffii TaxID=88036 RepID=UPI000D1CD67C|nr:RNA polymerase II subunit A C-terminal domain phosphatase ssu72 isoform X1 [Selaginella moellendorffii]|eukprot:XP_024520465.1 RNA polymerase II subunit A C-terminal domain phosphatase ssu72 isoform X1 [Selaginella moellendorffii]